MTSADEKAQQLRTLPALSQQDLENFQNPRLEYRRLLGEFSGTFILVLVACGSAVIGARFTAISTPVVAVAVGATLLFLILAFGRVSGAHFNPCITSTLALRGIFPWRRVPGYILAQFLGALFAVIVLRYTIGDFADMGYLTPQVDTVGVWFWEAFLTFLLLTILNAVINGAMAVGVLASVAMGSYLAVAIMIFGAMTGPAMNPVRQLAPALLAGDYDQLAAYLVAPFVGALLAVGFAYVLRGRAQQTKEQIAMAQGDVESTIA